MPIITPTLPPKIGFVEVNGQYVADGESISVVAGSYTGSGATSKEFDFGFIPKAFFVFTSSIIHFYNPISGVMTRSVGSSSSSKTLTISGTKLTVPDASDLNTSGNNYVYFAIR